MPIKLPSFRPRKEVYPSDLWTKCPSCSEMLFNKQLEKSERICPTCGHHFRLSAEARIALRLDERSFQEEDFGFMGGSMGAVVGEKVTRAVEQALAQRLPLIIVSASGGARMQEGTLALMQLVKTCAALELLRAAGVPYISVMSDPTTGGVFASFAVLGDINLAEPNALIGFAGARVSAGT